MSQPPASRTRETWRALRASLVCTRNRVVRSVGHVADYLLFGLVVTTVIATGCLQGAISMVDILPAMLGGATLAPLSAVMGCLTLIGTFGLSDLVLVQ